MPHNLLRPTKIIDCSLMFLDLGPLIWKPSGGILPSGTKRRCLQLHVPRLEVGADQREAHRVRRLRHRQREVHDGVEGDTPQPSHLESWKPVLFLGRPKVNGFSASGSLSCFQELKRGGPNGFEMVELKRWRAWFPRKGSQARMGNLPL